MPILLPTSLPGVYGTRCPLPINGLGMHLPSVIEDSVSSVFLFSPEPVARLPFGKIGTELYHWG